MGLIIKLKNLFQRGNIFIRLIYINVAVFFVTALITTFFQLFNKTVAGVFSFLELPASFLRLSERPWSLFSYMFMHADFLHLLFNMLWLYWFGMLFFSFFSAKHLRGLYILGGIFGGLLYMVCYNVFPYFRSQVEYSSMVGASASVLAIVIAVACRQPDYSIRLLFFGNIRLKYIALVVVLSDLLFITSGNAGGHIAHLGGAFAGFGFVAGLNKGVDMTSWINKFLDLILVLFEKTTWQHKHKPFMKVQRHSRNTKTNHFAGNKKTCSNATMDDILDKLKKSGYESLTAEEKKILFDASKR
jgi:membrane associated rhomboid family serine protease